MFISADQLLAHAIGDYILQSHWMATNKTTSSKAALCHVLAYVVPFSWLTWSPLALAVIIGSHFAIDRWRLARFVVLYKNLLLTPERDDVLVDTATGYPADCPSWLATWLLIIADNILHIVSNGVALKFL